MNIQSAPSDATDLVIVYHAGGGLNFPGSVIASEVKPGFKGLYDKLGGDGITPLPDAVSEIADKIGRSGWQPNRIILAGFSEGAQGVRTQLRAGYDVSAAIAADGTHAAANPDYPNQIKPWKDFADLAKAGDRVMIASHSTIPTPYKSTRETLRLITGFPLAEAGTIDDPVVTEEGNLRVYSVDGTQAADHVLQGQVMLPRMISEALSGAPPISALSSPIVWWKKILMMTVGLGVGWMLGREIGSRLAILPIVTWTSSSSRA